mmetsp:Transcript_117/g.203  ORF Transcript_117/g.203 Transcript_117/m.203 type:complete len:109 (-) Transcript_117:399-725(-)
MKTAAAIQSTHREEPPPRKKKLLHCHQYIHIIQSKHTSRHINMKKNIDKKNSCHIRMRWLLWEGGKLHVPGVALIITLSDLNEKKMQAQFLLPAPQSYTTVDKAVLSL